EGTFHSDPITHCINPWAKGPDGHEGNDCFFEASSPRKVMGKYVYIYSKRYDSPVPELGVTGECNGFLSYMVSDNPLEGFKDGGDISFNGGEILFLDENNKNQGTMTYRWGNNHGSLMQIEGQWYIFYHRQTGKDEFSRQAMIEPVDVAMDKNGKLFIGKITYENGEPVKSVPVEMTSQGVQVNGLDARKWISAGYACHLFGGVKGGTNGGADGAYIKAVYEQKEDATAPVVNITSSLTVGFRYLQFGMKSPKTVTVQVNALENVTINVRLDDFRGKCISTIQMNKGESEGSVKLDSAVIGKHAVYFEFLASSDTTKGTPIAEFLRFTFD
ncbi:MAG: hypothetical protein MJ188_09455, partial [Treponema sp.]|nr:hypothetical protein [Treponema sp.]